MIRFLESLVLITGVIGTCVQAEARVQRGRAVIQECRESIQVPDGSYCDDNCRIQRQWNGRAICRTTTGGTCAVSFDGTQVQVNLPGLGWLTGDVPSVPYYRARVAHFRVDLSGYSGTLDASGDYTDGYNFAISRVLRIDVNVDHDPNGNRFAKYSCRL